jgi:DNA-binding transcriptional LysR family regulator
MELRQLKYFVGVAEELHFSHAARKLFVSQPALSQQIKLLEAEVGVELFVGIKRTRMHRVELTEAGSGFLVEARRILQLSEKAIQNARRVGAQKPVITLGVFKLILPERIMAMLDLFSTHFPTVDIQLVELPNITQVQEQLAMNRVDLGMTVLPLVQEGLTAMKYAETDYSILMNRTHPLAGQPAVKLAQLREEKWIDHGREAGLFFGQIEAICQAASVNRESNIVQVVPSFDLLKSMVRLGKGIAFIPASLDLSQEPTLLSVPIVNEDDTLFKQLIIEHVLIHRTDQPNPLVRELAGLPMGG